MIRNKIKTFITVCMLAFAGTISSYAGLINGAECTGLTFSSTGSATWSEPDIAGEQVEKYELKLALMRNGSWDESYKTVKTDVNGYDFNFSKTGKYRYSVRAKFYGGNYGGWSASSPVVVVTKDDLNFDSWSDDNFAEPFDDIINSQNSQGNFGPGFRPDGAYLEGGYPAGFGPAYPNRPGTVGGYIQVGPGGIPNGMPGNMMPQYSYIAPGYPNNNNYNAGAPSATPNQGWIKGNAGWWYKFADGSYPVNSWQRINDKWYFFNKDGIMQTGWIWWNNCWYLCLPDGSMATGWQNANERWYYLNESGIMQTGYKVIDGKTYYLDATGARVSGGYSPDGHLFDKDGVMIK